MSRRRRLASLAAAVALMAAAPVTPVTPSWNGWHWAPRQEPLPVIGAVSVPWRPLLAAAAAAWSAGPVPLVTTTAPPAADDCAPGAGTVRVCSGDYGATGWLGYTDVWVTGRVITRVRIRLNDHYLAVPGRHDSDAWRRMTLCQELGHALGLAHADEARDNRNLGTCMDYSAEPAGGPRQGPLANVAPAAQDFAALAAIYGPAGPPLAPPTAANAPVLAAAAIPPS